MTVAYDFGFWYCGFPSSHTASFTGVVLSEDGDGDSCGRES